MSDNVGSNPESMVEGMEISLNFPVESHSVALPELLLGITDENLHGEWTTGSAVGNEVW